MKKLLSFIHILALGLCALPSPAQEYKPYGVEKQFPTYLEEMVAELDYPMAWGNSDITDFGEWRDTARRILTQAMMLPPKAPDTYAPQIIYEEQRDGYKARIVQINQNAYIRANVYMLLPDAPGPHPGILLFHDHGGHYFIGKEKMIRPINADSAVIEDADKWVDQCYGGQFVGDYLASNGYAVICGDAIFWGERGRKEGVDKNKLGDFAGNLLGIGRCMSGITTFEDSYLVDYFASLPEVDADRVGCMGFSMGAYRAWMLSAFTDIIKASASVCWMTTTDTQFSWKYGRENGGYANTLPSIRHYMDHPHVASIACPKPIMFINGDSDKLFPVEGVEKAYQIMHDVYASQGAADNISTEIMHMPHYCGPEVQTKVLAFFDRQFKK